MRTLERRRLVELRWLEEVERRSSWALMAAAAASECGAWCGLGEWLSEAIWGTAPGSELMSGMDHCTGSLCTACGQLGLVEGGDEVSPPTAHRGRNAACVTSGTISWPSQWPAAGTRPPERRRCRAANFALSRRSSTHGWTSALATVRHAPLVWRATSFGMPVISPSPKQQRRTARACAPSGLETKVALLLHASSWPLR